MFKADSRPLWEAPPVRLRVLTFLLIVALNLFDAANTLLLLENGAEEANPLMRWATEVHPAFFLVFKMALAVLGTLGVMAFVREFRFAWIMMKLLAAVYLLVAMLHLYLLFWSPIAL